MLLFKLVLTLVSPWALCVWGLRSAVEHEVLEIIHLMRAGN